MKFPTWVVVSTSWGVTLGCTMGAVVEALSGHAYASALGSLVASVVFTVWWFAKGRS
jgi:hypothetical protein